MERKGFKCRGVSSYEYTSTSLLIDIVHRQLTLHGHILQKGELENLVVTRFVDGKRDRGRQRETFLNYISKIVGKSPLELINLAKKRDGLQTAQPTSSGSKPLCKLCRTSRPIYRFLGMPAMRTRWMAGAVAHKSG